MARAIGCLALGVALALAGAFACARSEEPARPNVLIVVADDLGWGDVGYHTSEIRTPRIDRLASESVRLERFYAQPLCTPTRAALLTGRAPVRYGLQYSVLRAWSEEGLPAEEKLLSELLARAGYRTGLIGKWHLGHRREELLPQRRGFEHFYGHLTGAVDYFDRDYNGALDWQRNGESLREEGYSTDLLAAEAERFLAQGDDRPFFLMLAFGAPHAPLQAPADLVESYANIEDEQRRTLAAMVTSLDGALGRVLDALDSAGRARDTLVFFLSDNGAATELGGSNAPLREGKGTTFEGGVRVPALVRYPPELSAGESSAVFSCMDVFPTVARLAKLPLEGLELDGMDMWPILKGTQAPGERELFFAVEHRLWSELACMRGTWKLVRVFRPPWQQPVDHLFLLGDDPLEQKNLAAEQPEIVLELGERIEWWHALHPTDGLRYSRDAPEGFEAPLDLNPLAQKD